MTVTAAELFGDFNTTGLPSSGAKNVNKADARAWGTSIETRLDTLAAVGGSVYATKAAMLAVNGPEIGTSAIVTSDSTPANNGWYRKTSAAGTGSGTYAQITDVIPGYDVVRATDAGAGTPNAIVATSTLPVSATDGAQLVILNIFEANTASPVTVAFNGASALTMKTVSGADIPVGGLTAGMFVLGTKLGTTFRLFSDFASSNLLAQVVAQVAIATDQAGISTAQAVISTNQAAISTAAKVDAEAAAALANAARRVYADVAAGRAAVTNGETYLVVTANAGLFDEWRRVDASNSTLVRANVIGNPYAVAETQHFGLSVGDVNGYFRPFEITDLGYQRCITLQDCGWLNVYADSHAHGAVVVRDQHWLCHVSQRANWNIRNLAYTGFTVADAQQNVANSRWESVPGSTWVFQYRGWGPLEGAQAERAIVCLWTNLENGATLNDTNRGNRFFQNMPDLLQLLKARHDNIALMTQASSSLATETRTQVPSVAAMARRHDCDIIDARSIQDFIRRANNPLGDGSHPGTYDAMIYARPALDYLERISSADHFMKVYRLRGGVTVGSMADLNVEFGPAFHMDWKEIGIGHQSVNDAWLEKAFERNSGNFADSTEERNDEYALLAKGGVVSFPAGYGCIRLGFPVGAHGLDAAAFRCVTTASEAWVVDRTKSQLYNSNGMSGQFVQLTITNGVVKLPRTLLQKIMHGREVHLVLKHSGAFTLQFPRYYYSLNTGVTPARKRQNPRTCFERSGVELLTRRAFNSTTGLTIIGGGVVKTPSWNVIGANRTYGGPRDPDNPAQQITKVFECDVGKGFGDSFQIPATCQGDLFRFIFEFWAQRFIPPYLDNTISGYGFPTGEFTPRIPGTTTFAANSPVQPDTYGFAVPRLQTAIADAATPVATNAWEVHGIDREIGLGAGNGFDRLRILVTVSANQAGKWLHYNLTSETVPFWVATMSAQEARYASPYN